jgi:hypothetical protein
MQRRPAVTGALVLTVVVAAACSGGTSIQESSIAVDTAPSSTVAVQVSPVSTTAVPADVTDTAAPTVSVKASSTTEPDTLGQSLVSARDGLIAALRADSPELDHECRDVGDVDYCFERGTADLPVASATCALVNALAGATQLASPDFAVSFDPACAAVGTAWGVCYLVEIVAERETPKGRLLLIVFAPEDWPDVLGSHPALIVPFANGELDPNACVPT